MLALDRICELPAAFTPCDFRVRWAGNDWELDQARRLRRAVFCVEQGVFVGDDTDAVDARAHVSFTKTLVAVSQVGGMADQVVGTVRLHVDDTDGAWWGSRLAVHAAFRHHGRLGATLIRLAVSSARALGCERFLAHVQWQNLPLFEQMHWQLLREVSLHGRPHALMQAGLGHYPPCADPYRGFATRSRSGAS